jgi:hypothetical protein
MPLPPPRKPRNEATPPEEAPPQELEPMAEENAPHDLAERRRQLREQTLRGLKRENTRPSQPPPAGLEALPPPEAGRGLPERPQRSWRWWQYVLLFPVMLLVIGGLIFVLLKDPTEIQDRTDAKLGAFTQLGKLAPVPADAKDLIVLAPEETVKRQYALKFNADEKVVREWIANSACLKEITPEKEAMREVYKVVPNPEDESARSLEVTYKKMDGSVEVFMEGYKQAKAGSFRELVDQKVEAERKARAQKQGTTTQANTETNKRPNATPAPLSAAEAQRRRDEEALAKILRRPSQKSAPSTIPSSPGTTAPRPNVVPETTPPVGNEPAIPLPQ